MRTRVRVSWAIGAAIAVVFALSPASATAASGGFRQIPRPKNVIVMISDGCGYNHIAAADLYQHGATGTQGYEKWPVRIAMSTYPVGQAYDPTLAWATFEYVKSGYTDSAAAATAMSTGVKTGNGAIGVGPDGQRLKHMLERAEELGKATGVITTVELSHATPAGFAAHNAGRGNYADIAKEMVYKSAIEVVMGCGHPQFDDNGNALTTDPATWEYGYVGGRDTWQALLAGTAGGDADGDGADDPWTVVTSLTAFRDLATGPTPKRVFGVAEVAQTFQCNRSSVEGETKPYDAPLISTVPTLAEITKAALNVLDDDPDGLFLMIEGGAVDWASHANRSNRMIEEELDFDKAVEAVCEWVEHHGGWSQTLVIVTADHECGYLTGPGSGPGDGSTGPTWTPLANNGAGNLPGMQWKSGDHTNALVPFFAKGCGCRAFLNQPLGQDPKRGPYIDNIRLAGTVFDLWK
jgi:alkaline phosphatase